MVLQKVRFIIWHEFIYCIQLPDLLKFNIAKYDQTDTSKEGSFSGSDGYDYPEF